MAECINTVGFDIIDKDVYVLSFKLKTWYFMKYLTKIDEVFAFCISKIRNTVSFSTLFQTNQIFLRFQTKFFIVCVRVSRL